MSHKGKVLVAGLGSPHGDDRAGWLVVEQFLKKVCGTLGASAEQDENLMSESSRHLFQHVVVRRALIPLDLLDWLEGVSILHVCDAFEATKRHGKLHRFTWNAGRLADSDNTGESDVNTAPTSFRGRGSHAFGLPDVLQLAERTGLLPKQVIIWAIAGTCLQPEDVMSDETQDTVRLVVSELLTELKLSHA